MQFPVISEDIVIPIVWFLIICDRDGIPVSRIEKHVFIRFIMFVYGVILDPIAHIRGNEADRADCHFLLFGFGFRFRGFCRFFLGWRFYESIRGSGV